MWTHPPTPGFLWDLGKWKVKFGSIPNQYVQVNSGSRLVVGSSLLQVGSAFMISCSEWGRASLAWSHHGFCDQEFWDGYHELLAWSECSPHRAHLDLCSDKVVNRSLSCTLLFYTTHCLSIKITNPKVNKVKRTDGYICKISILHLMLLVAVHLGEIAEARWWEGEEGLTMLWRRKRQHWVLELWNNWK